MFDGVLNFVRLEWKQVVTGEKTKVDQHIMTIGARGERERCSR